MISPADLVARFAFADDADAGNRVALRLRIGRLATHRDLTFSELRREVYAQAGMFAALGARPGERVALLMPHSDRLVANFFAAIWAGLVPSIIAWPTTKMDPEKYERNLRAVLASLRAEWLATDQATLFRIGSALNHTKVVDGTQVGDPALGQQVSRHESECAFIQFSGGTTGTQKSVPISFQHLSSQLGSYARVLGIRDDDAIISWLPLYHDMGLIACLVMPFVFRIPVTMFAPMEWVMDPRPFLRAMGETRSTLAWLPNFAFSFLAARGQIPTGQLDLSTMRAFVNCSEPVRAESLDAFRARFVPHGLRSDALQASYAMAEATFAVTQTTHDDPPRTLAVSRAEYAKGHIVPEVGGRVVVSSGRTIPGIEARIVDEKGEQLDDGALGEIQLRGPFVMDDYLDAQSSSRGARWAFRDGWYQTGDLGAWLDGHLFVTGRRKDVVIVGGINVYPEDVEAAVGELPGVHAGRVVAMGLEAEDIGTERLVVVAEIANESDLARAPEIEADAAKTILAVAGTAAYKVFVVPPKWVVKSTAGKISRVETRARLLAQWAELTQGDAK